MKYEKSSMKFANVQIYKNMKYENIKHEIWKYHMKHKMKYANICKYMQIKL